jgi:hypothetical protein
VIQSVNLSFHLAWDQYENSISKFQIGYYFSATEFEKLNPEDKKLFFKEAVSLRDALRTLFLGKARIKCGVDIPEGELKPRCLMSKDFSGDLCG